MSDLVVFSLDIGVRLAVIAALFWLFGSLTRGDAG
jgi:hypothetical protein